MSLIREPLGPISINRASSGPETPRQKPVYPIFLSTRTRAPQPSTQTVTSSSPQGRENLEVVKPLCDGPRDRKRLRLSFQRQQAEEDLDVHLSSRNSISDYFCPRAPLRVSSRTQTQKIERGSQVAGAWRRSRRRLGVGASYPVQKTQTNSMLPHLVTQTGLHHQGTLSTVMLPSVGSPSGNFRDYDPALVLAFNDHAKMHTASEAHDWHTRRLLAIAGEEGGIKIMDIDSSSSCQSGATGQWWKAHNNGILDLKWMKNDTHLLSASADQTLRLFDLGNGTPRNVATMTGHTSTIKSIAVLDSGHVGGGADARVIASGGRDGNINIYDLRCPGRPGNAQRFHRTRSTSNLSDPSVRSVEPVLTLRQPHNAPNSRRASLDARSSSHTITSLVSLQAMPGILASGGTTDGVVKLWDIRAPGSYSNPRPRSAPFGVLPDPTITGDRPSRRPRSVNALCESPTTGDLYALCGDSQIHVLRPSASSHTSSKRVAEAILPRKYVHPDLLTRSFYIRMSLSPDGRYLACGSSHAGVMTWDTLSDSEAHNRVHATRFLLPSPQNSLPSTPEVIAVDWGKDVMAASSDDSRTRLWRVNLDVAERLEMGDDDTKAQWCGMQR